MIAIFWNRRGLGQAATMRALRELCNSHRPDLIFLSETKISETLQIQKLVYALKFDDMVMIPSNGASGGVVLLWKSKLNIQVVVSTENYISVLVLNDSEQHS